MEPTIIGITSDSKQYISWVETWEHLGIVWNCSALQWCSPAFSCFDQAYVEGDTALPFADEQGEYMLWKKAALASACSQFRLKSVPFLGSWGLQATHVSVVPCGYFWMMMPYIVIGFFAVLRYPTVLRRPKRGDTRSLHRSQVQNPKLSMSHPYPHTRTPTHFTRGIRTLHTRSHFQICIYNHFQICIIQFVLSDCKCMKGRYVKWPVFSWSPNCLGFLCQCHWGHDRCFRRAG